MGEGPQNIEQGDTRVVAPRRDREDRSNPREDRRYTTLSATISVDLKRRLKARAVAADRKMWVLLEEALEQYLS
jgi:hypothetical protein